MALNVTWRGAVGVLAATPVLSRERAAQYTQHGSTMHITVCQLIIRLTAQAYVAAAVHWAVACQPRRAFSSHSPHSCTNPPWSSSVRCVSDSSIMLVADPARGVPPPPPLVRLGVPRGEGGCCWCEVSEVLEGLGRSRPNRLEKEGRDSSSLAITTTCVCFWQRRRDMA